MRTDEAQWWRRKGSPERGFHFVKVDGSRLRSATALARIRALAIPPAWTNVHISPEPGRPIQAWGVDDAGRRQYIYSDHAVQERDSRKWRRVLRYSRRLPLLRAVTDEHLRGSSLDRNRVLATVVRLMIRGHFRVGSERYAVTNKTFGIATLKKSHLLIDGRDLLFTYHGKQRIFQRRFVASTPLVEIVQELLELPGRRLFRYLGEDGMVRNVTAGAVNRYIRDAAGERFTSKDIRTFGGTVRAATILADLGPPGTTREAKSNVLMCCRLVASELGNTPTIARSAYIHPTVLGQYEEHGRTMKRMLDHRLNRNGSGAGPVDYYPEEAALIRFLEKYG